MNLRERFVERHIAVANAKANLACRIFAIFKDGEYTYKLESCKYPHYNGFCVIDVHISWSEYKACIYRNSIYICDIDTINSRAAFVRNMSDMHENGIPVMHGDGWAEDPDRLIELLTKKGAADNNRILNEAGIYRISYEDYNELVLNIIKYLAILLDGDPVELVDVELDDEFDEVYTDIQLAPHMWSTAKNSIKKRFLKCLDTELVITRYYIEVSNLIFIEFGGKSTQEILNEFEEEFKKIFSIFEEGTAE